MHHGIGFIAAGGAKEWTCFVGMSWNECGCDMGKPQASRYSKSRITRPLFTALTGRPSGVRNSSLGSIPSKWNTVADRSSGPCGCSAGRWGAFVAGADNAAASNPAPAEGHGERRAPVIATGVSVDAGCDRIRQ